MKRHYYLRGRRIEVDQVEDVVAVCVAVDKEGKKRATTKTFGTSVVSDLRGSKSERMTEALDAFEKASWVFVKPSRAFGESLARGDRSDDWRDAGKLVERADGSPAVDNGRLNVRLDPTKSAEECEAILAEKGLEIVVRLRFASNLYEVRVTEHDDAMAASEALHGDDDFLFAEPAFVEHIPGRATPTDPDYGDQWQWSNDGSGGGTAGADVSAEAAWDHTRGAGVRVAVIDNGFDPDHEDLASGVVAESGSFDGAGFNMGTAAMPDGDHGTFCAGMVGARWNSGSGGVGAAPDSDLMLLTCLVDQLGSQATLARAVAYAIDPTTEVPGADPADGADIVVCSLGPAGADWNLTSTLDLALETAPNGRGGMGTCVFWAASNSNNVDVTQDEVVSHPDVIAVVRSDNQDNEDNAARGDTVELIAPGVDVYSTYSGDAYGTGTGTSYAAPCAAGCAALALSVNPDLTRDELRQVMQTTADKIGGVAYDATGHNDDYGFGRVNAENAVLAAALRVELETPSLAFTDVPEGETTARAVIWECFGLESITFEVVGAPTGPFTTLLSSSVTIPAPGVTSGERARLWFAYTGTTAGDDPTGSVTVRCVETGEEWDVAISATTIARPTAAVMMVLDQSGSMNADAGDGRKRFEVLREAAQNFVDVLQPETGVGIVRFDHDAYDTMAIQDAGPEVFGPGRAAATAAVATHTPNPAGATSIGDGVERAGMQLDAVAAAYDTTAMVVLTDGQENSSKFIADVSGSIDDRVFAIGLGTPSAIDPDKLSELTDGSDGYVVMTGNLSQDEYFILSKYYLQILAGLTNEEVVLDPQGYVAPGKRAFISFSVTEADYGSDVILVCPQPAAMRLRLHTPSGAIIDPSTAVSGVKFVAGKGVAYYRLTLPLVDAAGKSAGAGRWKAELYCEPAGFRRYLNELEKTDGKAYEFAATHGLRYALEVHARSSLRMTAALERKENAPGTPVAVVAQISEYGLPVERRAEVVAFVAGPNGQSWRVRLDESQPGRFDGTIEAKDTGNYSVRIVANGRTLRKARFTREQTLTTSIYKPKSSKEERPPQGGRPGGGSDSSPCATLFAELATVLLRERLLLRYVARAMGIDRDRRRYRQFIDCLEEIAAKAPWDASSLRPTLPTRPTDFTSSLRPDFDFDVVTTPTNTSSIFRPGGRGDDRTEGVVEALRRLADTLDEG